MTNTTNQFSDFDALMDASMDDMESLPPVGVPPTGHYNLLVSAERKSNKEGTSEYIQFSYEVEAVNEVKNEDELSQAAIGMKFSNNFSPIKKDGTVNKWGIGFLKEALAPFAEHYGISNTGALLEQIKNVSIAATVVRKINKAEPDRFDFSLKDVVVL
jgi:hypothetical protein